MRNLLWYGLILASLAATRALADQEFVCAGYQPAAIGTDNAAAKRAGPPVRNLPATGTVRVLVIFAKFKDETSGDSAPPDFADDIFNPGREGSFTNFYDTMSFGQLKVEGTVLPKRYTSTHPASAFLAAVPGAKGKYGDLVLDVLEQADRDIDFAQFDNDGPDGVPNSGDDSGVVDFVFVNMLTTPRDFIVGGATGIASLGFRDQFVSQDMGMAGKPIRVVGTVGRGAVLQEGTFAQTVGTMAHEFGHSLDLPDLYDLEYDGPEDDSAGIGRWGLMGWGAHGWNGNDGPNPLSAWSREELGWIGPGNSRLVDLDGDIKGLELKDLESGGAIFKIPLGVTGNQWYTGIEYLLIEHRSRASSYYNRNMPAEGVLVWHTRPRVIKVDHESFKSTPMTVVNVDEAEKGVDLICADGAFLDAGYPLGGDADGVFGRDNLDFWSHDRTYRTKHGGNQGDATDPFDGARFRRLSLNSNPRAILGDGLPPLLPGWSLR